MQITSIKQNPARHGLYTDALRFLCTYKYVISDKQGLHATNAMSLCRAACGYESSIYLKSDKKTADCKNVLSLMSLGARQGESLELEVEGPDEVQAAGFLKGLLRTIL